MCLQTAAYPDTNINISLSFLPTWWEWIQYSLSVFCSVFGLHHLISGSLATKCNIMFCYCVMLTLTSCLFYIIDYHSFIIFVFCHLMSCRAALGRKCVWCVLTAFCLLPAGNDENERTKTVKLQWNQNKRQSWGEVQSTSSFSTSIFCHYTLFFMWSVYIIKFLYVWAARM